MVAARVSVSEARVSGAQGCQVFGMTSRARQAVQVQTEVGVACVEQRTLVQLWSLKTWSSL